MLATDRRNVILRCDSLLICQEPRPTKSSHMLLTRLSFLVALVFSLCGLSRATDIRVVSSGGFAAAYSALAPEFEQSTGNHLIAGIVVGSKEPEAAKALIAFLASATAAPAISASGLEPKHSANGQ
jgi:ABC-type molybdate transport system substrate-binding protein